MYNKEVTYTLRNKINKSLLHSTIVETTTMIKRDKLMNDYESRNHKQRVSQSLVFNIIHVTIKKCWW